MRLGTRVMVLDEEGKATDIFGQFNGIGHVQGVGDHMEEMYIVLLNLNCRGVIKPDIGPRTQLCKSEHYVRRIVIDPLRVQEAP